MASSEDPGVERQGQGNGRPVPGISGDPSASLGRPMQIEGARDDFNHPMIDQSMDRFMEQARLLSGQLPGCNDLADPTLQFVLGFLPLLLGDDHLQLSVAQQRPASFPKQFGD